jgi:hypothetical protein
MQVLGILKCLVVMTSHNIGQIGVNVSFARENRHYSEALVAGRAKGPETLNIRNCHNTFMVANGSPAAQREGSVPITALGRP